MKVENTTGGERSFRPAGRWMTIWIAFLALLIAFRVALLIFAPHLDPSEARYAEISRLMVQSGDWITPQHQYGVPFWAKPPLSMWLSAGGMELFGVNEFGSRIFIFLSGLAVLASVYRFAAREHSPNTGIISAAVLMGTPMFFYCSAAVMTDMPLALGTTLTMLGSWGAINYRRKIDGYLFFLGVAIGMLAKGPVAIALTGMPLLIWVIVTKNWKRFFETLPWISGGIPAALLTVAWYAAAEQKTPGFLDYFILGEHWKRFVETGWDGDLYGNAHAEIPGTIWFFALIAAFPWILMIPYFGKRLLGPKTVSCRMGQRLLFLTLWMIWTLVFFTPARNIISTYTLPALPALALLFTEIPGIASGAVTPWLKRIVVGMLAVSMILVIATTVLTLGYPNLGPQHTEKYLIREYEVRSAGVGKLVYFAKKKYSAGFYSGGSILNVNSIEDLSKHMNSASKLYVASRPKDFERLPRELKNRLRLVHSWGKQHGLYEEITESYGS